MLPQNFLTKVKLRQCETVKLIENIQPLQLSSVPHPKSMTSSNFNRMPLRDCVRDKEYFLEDGDCAVLVEDTLFKVCFMLRLE